MIKFVDDFLNRITMYRLVLYYLGVLLVAAFVFSFFGILPYDPTAIAFSVILITGICWVTNFVFSRVFSAATNIESVYITAFILALIITPVMASNRAGVGFLVFVSVWAMASKYMLAPGKKHIFNPVAFAVALSALVINQPATWWVAGNLPLLPFVFIGGILIVRKVQRFDLVGSFAAVALATTIATAASGNYSAIIAQTLLHSSFFFFVFVMLTEPLTTPPGRAWRVAYGALVGFLFAPNIHIGSFYFTPELALLAGNAVSYMVSPKGRFMLVLTGVETAAKDVYDFIFTPDRPLSFRPGQYLEWTLGHHYPDNRGNRRYFTVASSPTENNIRLGVKFYSQSSTFKRALASMKIGDKISMSHLSGGFVLPKDKKKKLVFIAGGIGVTPFRSMIKYLLDKKEIRPIVVLYSNKTAEDVAYREIFDRAKKELGIETVYVLTAEKSQAAGTYSGSIDAGLIGRAIPDYKERTFYISGPRAMVEAFKKTLREMGISRFKVKSDFFPGFV